MSQTVLWVVVWRRSGDRPNRAVISVLCSSAVPRTTNLVLLCPAGVRLLPGRLLACRCKCNAAAAAAAGSGSWAPGTQGVAPPRPNWRAQTRPAGPTASEDRHRTRLFDVAQRDSLAAMAASRKRNSSFPPGPTSRASQCLIKHSRILLEVGPTPQRHVPSMHAIFSSFFFSLIKCICISR